MTISNGKSTDEARIATGGDYRKIDGRWMVMPEHNSVTFDAGSGKASPDLRP